MLTPIRFLCNNAHPIAKVSLGGAKATSGRYGPQILKQGENIFTPHCIDFPQLISIFDR
ncbi:MAG: hypothetical protein ACI8R4_003904 [Paracoccaceae bacterium]|jgi:hypothetical protein